MVWNTDLRSYVTDGGLQGFKKIQSTELQTHMKQFSNSLLFSSFPRRCQLQFDILNCLICPLLSILKQISTLPFFQLLSTNIPFSFLLGLGNFKNRP